VSRAARRRLAVAAGCAVLALGLPWDDVFAGAQHPARVAVVGAVVLTLVGLRTRSRVALRSAVVVGGAGVLLGDLTVSGGRLALAVAVLALVLGLRTAGLLQSPEARPTHRPGDARRV
jgi:hypothetical protein